MHQQYPRPQQQQAQALAVDSMSRLGHLAAPKPSKPSVQPSALRSSLPQMLDPAKIKLN